MTTTLARPPLFVTADEYERLLNLAYAAQDREPGADALIDELGRAQVGLATETPAGVVRMHSRVSFTYDQKSYRDFALVYPHEADINAGRISVLTQVGAMLLGLQAGQSIAWTDPQGRAHQLDVEAVARG